MRKILFLSVNLFLVTANCFAIDHSCDKLLSYCNITPGTTTQAKVTTLLGAPSKIEENKKRTLWYYNDNDNHLVISWNKTADLVRFSYTCEDTKKCVFDNSISTKLHSGDTNMAQAIKLLGTPKDMTVKEGTQEVHYAYSNSVLRLFFRNRVLVDFTLLSQN